MLKIGDFSKLAQVSVKTLRYYHQVGLLKPAWTDRFNGYRYYNLEQLSKLNSILALKELGFSLEQIQKILQEDLSMAELRGMMRLKQAELEQHIKREQARLDQIDARLRQINQEGALPEYDVVIKQIKSRQVAGLRKTIPEMEQVTTLFSELYATLPGASLANDPTLPAAAIYYDREFSDRGIDVEAAAPVTHKAISRDQVVVHQLPGAERMACVIHKGDLHTIHNAHLALTVWADTNRYRIAGPNREIFLQGFLALPEQTDHTDLITEVQFPVERKPIPILIQKYQESEKMEPKIVTKPAFTVVGMKYHGKNENNEIPQLWGQYNPRVGEIRYAVNAPVCYGVCGHLEESGKFSYLAAVQVGDAADIPSGMESWEVEEQEYAVFPCTLTTIHETYEYAHNTWLPGSGYERLSVPDFELYDETFDGEDPESILYVYIPIGKKS
jgi:predicted transcriptional regulator YdeE